MGKPPIYSPLTLDWKYTGLTWFSGSLFIWVEKGIPQGWFRIKHVKDVLI